MSIHMPELAKQHQAHMDRRLKLWGKSKAANENAKPVIAAIVQPVVKPVWILQATFFDSHVNLYREHKFNRYIAFIKRRCEAIGIPYDTFINTGRKRKGSMELSLKRHQIRWETKKKFPELSLPHLSRLCGGLDHTSIIWSIQRMEKLISEGYKIQGEDDAEI